MTINPISGYYFRIPECVATTSPSLLSVIATSVVVDDFSNFPSSITLLRLTSSLFGFSSTDHDTIYFNTDGSIIWNQIWTRFPSLQTLDLSSGNLIGTIPSGIPTVLNVLQLFHNRLTGTIPTDIFSKYYNHAATFTNVSLGFNSNLISGIIPVDLFNHLGSATWSSTSKLSFSARTNSLSGSLPSNLLSPLASANLTLFILDLGVNSLNGTIPNNFFPSHMTGSSSPTTLLIFDITSNIITGTIPSMFFANTSPISAISFLAANNKLSGSLPASFLPNNYAAAASALVVNLYNNSLTGSIPPTFLTATLAQNVTFNSLQINLALNSLSGSIPSQFFYKTLTTRRGDENNQFGGDSTNTARETSAGNGIVSLKSKASLALYFQSNRLAGSIPSDIFLPYVGTPSTYAPTTTFVAFNNSLTGPLPNDLLSSLVYSPTLNLDFHLNSITGPLPALCAAFNTLYLDLSSNSVDGTIPSAWQDCTPASLDFTSNTNLSGTIPSNLFRAPTMLRFVASKTSLYGNLPPVSGPNTTLSLQLEKTFLQFCSAPSNESGSYLPSTCVLDGTEACNCASSYPNCRAVCAGSPVGPVAPGTPPAFIPPPSEPVAAPVPESPPQAPSTPSCSNSTRPTIEFVCVDGTWTAPASNGSVLVVPPGAGTVVIVGNVNSSSVEIHGLGTTVEIGGSVVLVTSVQVQFSSSQAETLGNGKVLQILMTLSNSSTANLSSIDVSANVASGSCKKVKVEKVVLDDGATLGAYFTLDKSGCRTWWIILVSVICGLILLAVIVIAALAIFWKPFREKIRPYSKHRRDKPEIE